MFYQMTVPQFSKMLKNFSAILDKAAAHADVKKFDFAVLLQSRLAPDQFNFTRQIQVMCDTAKMCVASLTNKEAPVHADTESTLPELRARIDSVVAYLSSFSEKDFSNAQKQKISRPRWEGKYLNAEEFLMEHAIPNFYFHFATAYSILRHNGVDVGKKDFLGALPYKKD